MHEDHENKGARYSAFFSALLDDRFHETGSRGTPAFKSLPVSIEGRGEQNSVKSVGGTGVGYVAGSIAIEHCQRSRRADRCSSHHLGVDASPRISDPTRYRRSFSFARLQPIVRRLDDHGVPRQVAPVKVESRIQTVAPVACVPAAFDLANCLGWAACG
jgi:hypothetical protein